MRRFAVGLCALALFAAACGDDGGASPTTTTSTTATSTTATATSQAPESTTTTEATPTTTTTAEPARGCTAAATEARTLVDETRITPATAESEELASRTLDVWIDRPVEAGPWPLLIFAHGLTGHPRSHETHRTSLAEECFVVVAPAFPLTNTDVPGAFLNAGDTAGQTGDVSFLIDEALLDADLAADIDPERIGVIGHSLGGLTTAGAALAIDGDVRVSAAVVMSAGFGQARDDVAVMVLHGDADDVVPVASSIGSYAFLEGRGIFVTLLGGDHLSGILDDESDYGPVVRAITSAFFALELDNDASTVDELFALPLDLASIEARTADGVLADWRDYFLSGLSGR